MSEIMLWVTDPWNTLAHSEDTTLRLHQEALNLRVPSYWSGSDFLLNPLNPSRLFAQLNAGPNSTEIKELQPSKIRQLHYRVDPPVDSVYLSLLEKIAHCIGGEKPILSPPLILRSQSEKIPPTALSHLAPAMSVIRDPASANAAFDQFRDRSHFVTKPLNQAQSIGVKLWDRVQAGLQTLEQWNAAFTSETSDYSEPLVVQEYLPGIQAGELRMWFAAGQLIGALKKHPKVGDFRVLIDEGSKIEAYTLNAPELAIAEEVGAVLKQQGVALAAIDFISGRISDYNITSPGLLVQLERVHGKNFAREVLKQLLQM